MWLGVAKGKNLPGKFWLGIDRFDSRLGHYAIYGSCQNPDLSIGETSCVKMSEVFGVSLFTRVLEKEVKYSGTYDQSHIQNVILKDYVLCELLDRYNIPFSSHSSTRQRQAVSKKNDSLYVSNVTMDVKLNPTREFYAP